MVASVLGGALWAFRCAWLRYKKISSLKCYFFVFFKCTWMWRARAACSTRQHQPKHQMPCVLTARLQMADLGSETGEVLGEEDTSGGWKEHTQACVAAAGAVSASETRSRQSQPSSPPIRSFWSSPFFTFCVSEAQGREKKKFVWSV